MISLRAFRLAFISKIMSGGNLWLVVSTVLEGIAEFLALKRTVVSLVEGRQG